MTKDGNKNNFLTNFKIHTISKFNLHKSPLTARLVEQHLTPSFCLGTSIHSHLTGVSPEAASPDRTVRKQSPLTHIGWIVRRPRDVESADPQRLLNRHTVAENYLRIPLREEQNVKSLLQPVSLKCASQLAAGPTHFILVPSHLIFGRSIKSSCARRCTDSLTR